VDIYFFALKDNYIVDSSPGHSRIELTVQWENKYKKISFDDGNPEVPPALVGFQKMIEQTLDPNN